MTKLEDSLGAGPGDITPQAAQAAERFAAQAIEERAADLAYSKLDSPVGSLIVVVSEQGLVRLAYEDGAGDDVLADVARRVSPRILRSPRHTDDVRRQLDEYFHRARRDFDLPIDWSLTRGFAWRVLHATHEIPYGRVSTYAEVAARAGSPRATRAAGNALGSNPMPIVVPCHRVLRSGGGLGGYTGGLDRKRTLLEIEGFAGA